jgi:hypothetical protein
VKPQSPSARPLGAALPHKSEYRNTKSETNRKHEIRTGNKCLCRRMFGISNFELDSDFDIRISNFEAKPLGGRRHRKSCNRVRLPGGGLRRAVGFYISCFPKPYPARHRAPTIRISCSGYVSQFETADSACFYKKVVQRVFGPVESRYLAVGYAEIKAAESAVNKEFAATPAAHWCSETALNVWQARHLQLRRSEPSDFGEARSFSSFLSSCALSAVSRTEGKRHV